MLKFGIDNVRRLEHVDPIEIKPITLLLGRNSGGKSTFLRTFPLFRQSLMTRTSSPILWYGDLVDFGSFDTVLGEGCSIEIRLFLLHNRSCWVVEDRPVYLGEELGYYRRAAAPQTIRDVRYIVGIERRGERTRISSISINIANPELRVLLERSMIATQSGKFK